MDAGRREQGGKTLHKWLLWWQADPGELERQVESYDTLGMLASERKFSYLLAMATGFLKVIMGLALLSRGGGTLNPTLVSIAFAEGLLFFALGWLVYRGSRAGMLGMMFLWTAALAFGGVLGQRHLDGMAEQALLAVAFVVGWTCFMRPLTMALRVERLRGRIGNVEGA